MAKFTIPEIKGVVQGEFGKTFKLTLTDFNGNAQDVSSYDGDITAYARHEKTGKEISASNADFDSDGTDGVITFSWADGDISLSGMWKVQVVLEDSGATLKGKTLPSPMDVQPAYDG